MSTCTSSLGTTLLAIADVQQEGQICSFYATTAKEGDKRICRTCDVSVENACRTNLECHRYMKDDIMSLFEAEDWEGLDEINQRYVVNSFIFLILSSFKKDFAISKTFSLFLALIFFPEKALYEAIFPFENLK